MLTLSCIHLELVCVLFPPPPPPPPHLAVGLLLIGNVLPVWTLIVVGGTLTATFVALTSKNEKPPRYHGPVRLLAHTHTHTHTQTHTNTHHTHMPQRHTLTHAHTQKHTNTHTERERWRAPLRVCCTHTLILLHLQLYLPCLVVLQVFSFLGFVSAIIWIYVVANEIVALLQVGWLSTTYSVCSWSSRCQCAVFCSGEHGWQPDLPLACLTVSAVMFCCYPVSDVVE